MIPFSRTTECNEALYEMLARIRVLIKANRSYISNEMKPLGKSPGEKAARSYPPPSRFIDITHHAHNAGRERKR